MNLRCGLNRILGAIVSTFLALALVVWTGGCGVACLPVPTRPQVEVPPGEPLKAGIAQVDITPQPGLGLFAHGPESRIATGVGLRLRCQIFVLTGPSGVGDANEAIALIPCDLPAPSLALQRAIAARVAHLPLPANRIALMASHTHFGPGHYLPAGNYSGPFTSRRTGFEQQVLDALASSIAGGIEEAFGDLKRARIGWAYDDVDGVSLNRAMTPLRLNTSLPAPIWDALHGGHARPHARAVDRRLSLLRIDQWSDTENAYVPAGAYAVFGVHPTVINSRNSLYTGDLFGYATRHAAQVLSQDALRPVRVGLANGLEGDVTSDRGDDSPHEARRLGHRLGEAIAQLYRGMESDMSDAGSLQVAYRELNWPKAQLQGGETLCELGAIGAVSAGGASDHPTSMRVFAAARPGAHLADGSRGRCDPYKFPLLEPLPSSEPGRSFPAIAPIMLMRIGDGLLATVPAELTTVTGMRIAKTVEDARPEGLDNPVTMVGLTNEYLLYVATGEEYAAQYYEGASTVYGPRSAEFLRQQLGCLAGKLFAHAPSAGLCTSDQAAVDTFRRVPVPAESVSKLESCKDDSVRDPGTVGLRRGVSGLVYRLRFGGPLPGGAEARDQVRVRVACGPTTMADDTGEQFSLRYDDRAQERPWSLEWRVEAGDACCPGLATFELTARGQGLTVPFDMRCGGGTP